MTNKDSLIAQFLKHVEQAGSNDLFEADAPPLLRSKPLAHCPDMFQWEFTRIGGAPWIATIENSIGLTLPLTYRHLVTSYLFPEFEIGHVTFFANTGTPVYREFVNSIKRDPGIAEPLLEEGFIQIGQGGGDADYDPVCLDTVRGSAEDAPLVKVDHEELLLRTRIKVVRRIATSLENFMLDAIS